MAYDKNLNTVLENATDEELLPIVDYLCKKLSNFIEIDERYKKSPDKPTEYVDLIADEIRSMGGNSFANLVRGEGVSYHEVVCDVADKLKVPYNKNANVARIEECIMQKVFEDAWEKLSPEEREVVVHELSPDVKVSKAILTMSAQAIFKMGGFASYKISLIVVNSVSKALLGRGLALAANAGLTRSLCIFTGPIGWVLTALWALIDIAGPAYKATIPCVLHVAMLRQKQAIGI